MRTSLNGADWLFRGFLGEAWRAHVGTDAPTAPAGWHPGTVPGSVQDDLWRGGLVPDPYRGTNSLALEWVPARHWVYRKGFFVGSDRRGARARLAFEGLDYAAQVFLNGEALGRHESQFVPAHFEVADGLAYDAENVIAVVLEPAPPGESQTGRTSKVRHHRTRMNEGWDVCPRMPHLGIWDGAYLEFTGPLRLEDVWIRPRLNGGSTHADVDVQVQLSAGNAVDAVVEVVLRRSGQPAVVARERLTPTLGAGAETLRATLRVADPALWWPNGHGRPALYEAAVRVLAAGAVSDARTVPFGIRQVEWAANEAPHASARPYTVVVNGRTIYLKGWNWLPSDVLYGVERPERLARLMSLAGRAHVNLLRVWGGGLIERGAFYDACDRHGIMVWQEFVQSSSAADRTPSEDADYLDRMVGEAEGIVPRRRNHPSLVLWCGGNELEDADFLPLPDDAPVLAALGEVVRRLDPDRLWLPTSASGPMPFCGIRTATNDPTLMHDVHGPWHHQGLGGQYELFNRSRALLHSEFGAEALADSATLEAVLPEGDRWLADPANRSWQHLGGGHWLSLAFWRESFGETGDLATLVRAGQMLQAEAVRYALEANRRRRPENAGSLPWTLNESYPMAAGTAAVGYDLRPRPLYHAVARAYAPMSVTARFEAQTWSGSDTFRAELWVDHDGPVAFTGTLTVRLVGAAGTVHAEARHAVAFAPDRPQRLEAFEAPLAAVDPIFFLDLRLAGADGEPWAENRYLFSRTADLTGLLALGTTKLTARWERDGVTVANTGDRVAAFVWLDEERAFGDAPAVELHDNHLCLFPGERRRVGVTRVGVPSRTRGLVASAWNAAAVPVRPPPEEA